MVLKKKLTLYERSDDGNLIPQTVPIDATPEEIAEFPFLEGEKITIVPMTRGELKKFFSESVKDDDPDAEIVVTYCKDPVYTKEDMVDMRPGIINALARTILSESGVVLDKKTGKKSIEETDEFGKNS